MNSGMLGLLLILFCGYGSDTDQNSYLAKVSKQLDQITSASYSSTTASSAPGDTVEFSEPRKSYHKIVINPLDTLVGSASATFSAGDTTKMTSFYDGKARGTVYWDEQYVKVDSFQNHPYPFRLVHYPFYTKVNEILKYALTTTDSIQTDFKDYGDSVFFSLKIINKHVYFVIKPLEIKNEYIPEDEVSQFDVWFSKKDNMPYRMRSKWSHTTSFEYCSNAVFNLEKDVVFQASDYYPSHFDVVQAKKEPQKQKNDLVGKKAPDLMLKDIDLQDVKLGDLKSKVLLIQFTGVGCGPCHQSIPFLKKLVVDYSAKDFEFVGIETWSKNMDGLKRYKQNNELNFKFLKSTDDVTKLYGISSVPAFFIIDKDRIIRKVINGYSKGNTDKEIIESIETLL